MNALWWLVPIAAFALVVVVYIASSRNWSQPMFGYVIAALLPPVAMFQQGRPIACIVTIVLMCTVALWPIASLIAILSTRSTHIEDKRVARLEAASKAHVEPQA